MTVIFKNCPPKPRYTFVWDIETVLNHLSKFPDNLNLLIRVLSHKLTLLHKYVLPFVSSLKAGEKVDPLYQ